MKRLFNVDTVNSKFNNHFDCSIDLMERSRMCGVAFGKVPLHVCAFIFQ